MKITNPGHRAELLSAIRYLFSPSPLVGNFLSEVQGSSSAPEHLSGIVNTTVQMVNNLGNSVYGTQDSLSTLVSHPDCVSSVFSTPASWRSVNRKSECGSSMSNITCLRNTVSDWSLCVQAGTDSGLQVQTNMSVESESECSRRSSGTGYMDICGVGMSSKSLEYSKKKINHGKTLGIQMAEKLAPRVPLVHSKPSSNKRSVNLKKLILTLEPDQLENGDVDKLDKIRSWFVELDSDVTVKPMEGTGNMYTIIFQDVNAAIEALKFRRKGFKIRNKYPPRPCPTNHLKYRALKCLQVRRGKSFRGHFFKGVVEKGESVWVDQIKGRRARVINRGWVSLYTTDGRPLLVQEQGMRVNSVNSV